MKQPDKTNRHEHGAKHDDTTLQQSSLAKVVQWQTKMVFLHLDIAIYFYSYL